MEKLIKRTISFGKYAYYNKRRENEITVEIEVKIRDKAVDYETLEEVKDVPEVSICGNIWNGIHTDVISGGQNIDEIADIIGTHRIQRIQEIWNEYHLNDLKAGTKTQMEALKNFKKSDNYEFYTDEANYLKSLGLFEDRGYKYGHGWLYMPVPEEIIKELRTI